MNNLLRRVENGSSDPENAWRTSTACATSGAATVWVMHSSARLAADVVAQLRGLNLDAKLWDESHSARQGAAACDIVVADPCGLRMIARSVSRSAAPEAAVEAESWRGGLAPGVLRRVFAQIEARLAEKIDTDELATLAKLSGCHFSRAFRQSVGMPPHRYILNRRIAIGAGLVERTDRPMTDIALSVGFADHSHFTRMFVRMIGETPRAYRRRHR